MSAATRAEPSGASPSSPSEPARRRDKMAAPVVERVIASFAAKGTARSEVALARWHGSPAVVLRRISEAGDVRSFTWPAADLDDVLAALGVAREMLVQQHGPGTTRREIGRRPRAAR